MVAHDRRLDELEVAVWGDAKNTGLMARVEHLEKADARAASAARDWQRDYTGPIVAGVAVAVVWTVLDAARAWAIAEWLQ